LPEKVRILIVLIPKKVGIEYSIDSTKIAKKTGEN
jgi:hypothetical protein